MAQIKSALELALERTKDIQGDKEGLEAREARQRGMRLIAKAENDSEFDIQAELEKFKGNELALMREGMRQVLAGYINLPSGKEALERFGHIRVIIAAVAKNPQEMAEHLGEIEQFFGQYLQQKEQLIATLRQQLEPAMRQKEDSVYQQTGRKTRVTIETDPEFAKYLSTNLDKLLKQYQQALEPIREEVLSLIS